MAAAGELQMGPAVVGSWLRTGWCGKPHRPAQFTQSFPPLGEPRAQVLYFSRTDLGRGFLRAISVVNGKPSVAGN